MMTTSVAIMIIPGLEALARDFWAGMGWRDTFPSAISDKVLGKELDYAV